MKRQRKQFGSVVLDRRTSTWNFLWWEVGNRRSKRIGSLRDFPTKAAAWKKAKPLVYMMEDRAAGSTSTPEGMHSIGNLVRLYRAERMPQRYSTSLGYEAWLKNHIIPKWGDCMLEELQPRPVELWLRSLAHLAPKSKAHIRGLLHALWDFGMWRGDVAVQRNPMELVTIKGSTVRTRKPRSLTVEQFRRFAEQLGDPYRTIAVLCVCFGLRIGECLGLKWLDVDWLAARLSIERDIVRQQVDEVKTVNSARLLPMDPSIIEVLTSWKQRTQFPGPDDWMFASPAQLGRLPVSYSFVWKQYQSASMRAGIGRIGTHSLRHTYRSWLDAVGTGVAVQQKLMRHSDIRMTMAYGDVVTDEMAAANTKVAALALNGL